MKFKDKRIKNAIITLLITVIIGLALLALVLTKIVKLNNPSDEKYPVKGVDVSAY